MSSQGGPDSLTHKPLFAGGLQFSDGTLAEDVINDLPAKVPLLVALSATSLARARGHGDDPLAAVLIAQEILHGGVHSAEEPCTDAFHVSEAMDTTNAQPVHAHVEQSPSEPPPGIHGAGGSIAALAERRRSPPTCKMPVSNTAEL